MGAHAVGLDLIWSSLLVLPLDCCHAPSTHIGFHLSAHVLVLRDSSKVGSC